jgi:uncharacterized membrane protein
MYVRKSEIVMLDMTIEEGARLIVSAGLVAPQVKPNVKLDGKPVEATLNNPAMIDGRTYPARKSRTASSRPNR